MIRKRFFSVKYVDGPWAEGSQVPQRCVTCGTESSADGYFVKIEDRRAVRYGLCRAHFSSDFLTLRPEMIWFSPAVDLCGKLLTFGALARIHTPKRGKTSQKAFMINQVCRDTRSGCKLSNGAFVYADCLILEGE